MHPFDADCLGQVLPTLAASGGVAVRYVRHLWRCTCVRCMLLLSR